MVDPTEWTACSSVSETLPRAEQAPAGAPSIRTEPRPDPLAGPHPYPYPFPATGGGHDAIGVALLGSKADLHLDIPRSASPPISRGEIRLELVTCPEFLGHLSAMAGGAGNETSISCNTRPAKDQDRASCAINEST